MHQTVKVSSVGSVGDLGHIARALGDAGFNIEAIGGGEAAGVREDGQGVGIISLLIWPDEDSDLEQVRQILEGLDLDGGRRLNSVDILPSLDVQLSHNPGQLAVAASALGEAGINIMSVLLVDAHPGRAVVSLAFNEGDLDAARGVLEALNDVRVLPRHGGKELRESVDPHDGPDHPVHDDGPGH